MFLKKTKTIIGLLVLTILSNLTFSHTVLAEENMTEGNKPRVKIGISPVSQDLETLKPGETKTGKTRIYNLGTEAFDFTLSSVPYQVINEKYEADLSTQTTFTQISKWISFPNPSGHLLPGDSVEVDYTVHVPMDVPAGGQYAVIAASTDSTNTDNASIKTKQSVGMKVLAKVDGTTRINGTISNLQMKTFLLHPPISASSIVESSSNIHVTAKYNFEVYNFFTNHLAYSNDNKESVREKEILPNSKYLNETTWPGSPLLGIFRVRYSVSFLGKTESLDKVVIILPIWLIFLIALIIFLVIFRIISESKKRKTSKQLNRY